MFTFIEANTQFIVPKLELMVAILLPLSLSIFFTLHIVIAGSFGKKHVKIHDITSIITTVTTKMTTKKM